MSPRPWRFVCPIYPRPHVKYDGWKSSISEATIPETLGQSIIIIIIKCLMSDMLGENLYQLLWELLVYSNVTKHRQI